MTPPRLIPAFLMSALLASAPVVAQESAPPAEAGPKAAAAEPAAKPLPISKVTLIDGQVLRGQVVAEDETTVTLQLLSGGRLQLSRSSIKRIEVDAAVERMKTGEVWFKDPNRTRYLYAPSAMMLEQGEGYFSQKELLFSAIGYGITDNITVLVGTVLPFWFIGGGQGINLIGAVKAGFSPTEWAHVAAGFESIVLPGMGASTGAFGFGFLFGSATLGDRNAHFTVSVGKPFAFGGGQSSLGPLLIVIAGDYRFANNFAVVSEHWLMPQIWTSPGVPATLTMANSLAVRIMGERIAVDLGLITGTTGGYWMPIPIPWVDFTYNFGG